MAYGALPVQHLHHCGALHLAWSQAVPQQHRTILLPLLSRGLQAAEETPGWLSVMQALQAQISEGSDVLQAENAQLRMHVEQLTKERTDLLERTTKVRCVWCWDPCVGQSKIRACAVALGVWFFSKLSNIGELGPISCPHT